MQVTHCDHLIRDSKIFIGSFSNSRTWANIITVKFTTVAFSSNKGKLCLYGQLEEHYEFQFLPNKQWVEIDVADQVIELSLKSVNIIPNLHNNVSVFTTPFEACVYAERLTRGGPRPATCNHNGNFHFIPKQMKHQPDLTADYDRAMGAV